VAKVSTCNDKYNYTSLKYDFYLITRFVVLIFDEMKIQEDLVYDKTGERLHGFVYLGEVNEDLRKLEKDVSDKQSPTKSIATHMLTVMVRGIFFKLEFPYANFPTQGN
jgi:hypothetical protein